MVSREEEPPHTSHHGARERGESLRERERERESVKEGERNIWKGRKRDIPVWPWQRCVTPKTITRPSENILKKVTTSMTFRVRSGNTVIRLIMNPERHSNYGNYSNYIPNWYD